MSTTSPLDIRPAVAADAAALADVFAAAIAVKARDSYGPREREAWAARGTTGRFVAMIADPLQTLVVAATPAGVVGMAGHRGCEVSLLYAGPDAPPGTGSRLLTAIETRARESGHCGLTLTASRNALCFYLRHGYTVLRLASRPLPGGVSLPVCLMVKMLA